MSHTFTVVSYPRSGRHKFASVLTEFDNFSVDGEPVQPVAVGLFDGVTDDAPGFEIEPAPGVAFPQQIEDYESRDDGKLYLFGTHVRPSRVPGRKIVLWRDPREVAVSYAHWWQKSTGASDEEREVFLARWVNCGAKWTKDHYGANISADEWLEWQQSVQPGTEKLIFDFITPYNVYVALSRVGVLAVRSADGRKPIRFADLRAKDPIMYRRGLPGAVDEFPKNLKHLAQERFGLTISSL
jgi:hypothetical protein